MVFTRACGAPGPGSDNPGLARVDRPAVVICWAALWQPAFIAHACAVASWKPALVAIGCAPVIY
jgi:hypothetical protein